ncbi:MAG: flagellar biosynthesis protein FlhB [bacterium]|nr:flagellar biosynthesis protein FlhB [bacterium]
MSDAPGGERTEKATPRKREKALEKGQIALSQEVNSALVLLAGFSLLFVGTGAMGRILNDNARYLLGEAHLFRLDSPFALAEFAAANVMVLIKAVAPVAGGIMVVGLLANLMQVGWHVNLSALAFRGENINPLNGIKSMFSRKMAFELVKSLVKILLISAVSWWTVASLGGDLMGIAMLPLTGAASVGWDTLAKLVYRLAALMFALAAVDWAFQKWQHEESLKMTKQEVIEENKDVEGDPQIKARMRAIQIEAVRKRMMAEIPLADVVVTNPTHFAVALRYKDGEAAPRVVAKGQDHLAQTIKRIARENRIPVIENKPLARALHKLVKVGAYIPDDLYQAVAEVLAYVYRLKRA